MALWLSINTWFFSQMSPPRIQQIALTLRSVWCKSHSRGQMMTTLPSIPIGSQIFLNLELLKTPRFASGKHLRLKSKVNIIGLIPLHKTFNIILIVYRQKQILTKTESAGLSTRHVELPSSTAIFLQFIVQFTLYVQIDYV